MQKMRFAISALQSLFGLEADAIAVSAQNISLFRSAFAGRATGLPEVPGTLRHKRGPLPVLAWGVRYRALLWK